VGGGALLTGHFLAESRLEETAESAQKVSAKVLIFKGPRGLAPKSRFEPKVALLNQKPLDKKSAKMPF
jgi:hypothetical protein